MPVFVHLVESVVSVPRYSLEFFKSMRIDVYGLLQSDHVRV